jgi:hypothetical protein
MPASANRRACQHLTLRTALPSSTKTSSTLPLTLEETVARRRAGHVSGGVQHGARRRAAAGLRNDNGCLDRNGLDTGRPDPSAAAITIATSNSVIQSHDGLGSPWRLIDAQRREVILRFDKVHQRASEVHILSGNRLSRSSSISAPTVLFEGLRPRTPCTLSRAPLRRRAPFAWLTRCRSFADAGPSPRFVRYVLLYGVKPTQVAFLR